MAITISHIDINGLEFLITRGQFMKILAGMGSLDIKQKDLNQFTGAQET